MEHYFDTKDTYRLFLSLIAKINGINKQKFMEEIEGTFKYKTNVPRELPTRRLTSEDVQDIFNEVEELSFDYD
jgi:hypothetical protein